MTKKEQISEFLIDIFDRINIQTPSDVVFNEILDFVYKDISNSTNSFPNEGWSDKDVNFAFGKWIENR